MDMSKIAPPEWDQILRAAMKNDSLGIRRLVEQEGVSPSHSNAVKQSALHIAALWGNVEAVEELLKQKAEVNARNSLTGATPLHCATQSMKGEFPRRLMCMERLIAAGAKVDMVDFYGKLAGDFLMEEHPDMARKLGMMPKMPILFQAIEGGQVEEVQKLLLGAAETGDNKDDDKRPCYEELFMSQTPFQHAFNLLLPEEEQEQDNNNDTDRSKKLVEILKALLVAGANVNAVGPQTFKNAMEALENPVLPPLARVCTAIQQAYKNKQDATLLEETCRLLIQHEATVTPDLEQLLHAACRKNELQFAKLLTEIVRVDPNVKGRQGMTPLQFAARSGRTEMVQYLLSLPNIDISIPDDRGKTALDAAKVNEKEDVVALLEAFAKK